MAVEFDFTSKSSDNLWIGARSNAVSANSLIFMQKIFIIARNTFRETARDRVLYNLVLFVLLIIVAAIFLGDLSDGNEARVIVNMGLSAALLFGAFISTFVGVGLVSKEIERRTVFAIFAKPIGRAEFLCGKYFGLCLILLLNTAVMALGITLALCYVKGFAFISAVWGAMVLIFFELSVLTAVAILFSSFSSPTLSALFTFFVFVIGNFSTSLHEFADAVGANSTKIIFTILYFVLPNFSHLSFITPAAHGILPTGAQILFAAFYAAAYIGVLLAAAILIFNRRNFK